MSRLKETVERCKHNQRKLLIPYLVAGDPDLETSLQLMHELVKCGADIIELGIPFSDPASDGPVIQLAAERSLAGGTTLHDVLALVSRFRESDAQTPVVLMGYLNPVEVLGYELFAVEAKKSGVDGVLIVDLPTNEAAPLRQELQSRDIDTIFLVAPTTSEQRLQAICDHCSGYLYYVSLKGVTGAALTDTKSAAENIQRIGKFTDLPIVIGFGIKDGASAKAMAALGDGVIVGSALVEGIAELSNKKAADSASIRRSVAVIKTIRSAIDE